MPSNKQIRNACITINNTHQMSTNVDTTHIKYYIFGRERAPNAGTLHLQGHVEFTRPMCYTAIKRAFDNDTIHIEQRRGTQDQAINYCRKEDKEPFEFGEPKSNGRPKGRKTLQIHEELQEVIEMVKVGATPEEILEKEPAFYYRYKSVIMDLDHKYKYQKINLENKAWALSLVLNERQKEMLQAVEQQTDRQVTWIFDKDGGSGKSWYSKYMIIMHHAI